MEKFEQAARVAGYSNFTRNGRVYAHADLETFWRGYKAAKAAQPQAIAAQSAPAGDREAVEVVARLMHWKGRHPNPWKVVARMYSECAAGAYPNEWEEGAPLMTVAQHERILAAQQRTQSAGVPEGLLEWAVGRWHSECLHRPLQNVHRRSLDDTWRQVIRRLGGDPDYLLGPDHSTLLAAAPAQPAAHDQGEVQRLQIALRLSANRFDRLALEFPNASDMRWTASEWANEARSALAASTGQESE